MRHASLRAALPAALLLAACACGASSSSGATGPGAIPAAGAAAVPIENFARVDDGLYRGAQPDAAGFRALREMGVRTVVNLRSAHDDGPKAVAEGLSVIDIPMHAFVDSDPPTDEDVAEFFKVVLDPERRPVYVHCAYGKDRTGTMCALYRIEVDGWTSDAAFEEMRSRGFHEAYRDLERFVRGYAKRGFTAPDPATR